MRKLLPPVLVTIILLGAAWLVVDHYKNYQQNKTVHHEQAVAAKQSDEVIQLQTQLTGLQNSYNGLKTECQKGEASYALLTPVQKKTAPAPLCGGQKL